METKVKQFFDQNPVARSFIVGSFSSTCSTLLFQPLDLLKTRMQNVQYLTANSHDSGVTVNKIKLMTTFSDVIRSESIVGLWRGTVPSLLRCIPGVGLYFASLHQLQTLICTTDEKPSAGQAMVIGLSARLLAASILIPVTVIKTQFESGQFSNKSIPSAFRLVYSQHGLRGLYSGAFPTILRDVPYSGIYYMFYSQLRNYAANCCLNSRNHHDNPQPNLETFINFTCSLVSGIFASIITHPADVIKTRMQLDPKGFPGLSSSVAIIFRDKGSIGFFIGLTPRLMRRAAMTAFTWTIFEHCIRSIGIK
ncbi:mitochondrial glycine transporter B-like isoform X2 [Panonychus citri]|uniref:mitochondrial glycine transporter B-like isoform X2 n=1 Tax=Panonychus citri TaxID=50023 RepID=UPI00230715E2|nr:mitochondrial glycine transporter B-like isoform X2 [Panonychus citri]XP_053210410.1 mitochondrial glycine transporter B-like isoform X2 [Panonychus citri]